MVELLQLALSILIMAVPAFIDWLEIEETGDCHFCSLVALPLSVFVCFA